MPAFKREETIGRPEKLVTREQRRCSAIRDSKRFKITLYVSR